MAKQEVPFCSMPTAGNAFPLDDTKILSEDFFVPLRIGDFLKRRELFYEL